MLQSHIRFVNIVMYAYVTLINKTIHSFIVLEMISTFRGNSGGPEKGIF